ncbi:hypothetical protein CEXT_357911 [Caerostris extrusa]|uniref:Uncharacterized protein n=1 Tax=Caerostris extrusa TaxID=172846 RepID=A0AAV4XUG4_CAEEX|nr:hypothetical protein CEXT_357911 [Caerostris extrusa]
MPPSGMELPLPFLDNSNSFSVVHKTIRMKALSEVNGYRCGKLWWNSLMRLKGPGVSNDVELANSKKAPLKWLKVNGYRYGKLWWNSLMRLKGPGVSNDVELANSKSSIEVVEVDNGLTAN